MSLSACAKREQAAPAAQTASNSEASAPVLVQQAEPQMPLSPPAISGAGSGSKSEDPKPAPETAPLDPRVAAAAALAHRTLSDPTPQMVHARKKDQAPKGWDREKYLNDPAAYLDLASPSRSVEPAQPAADVPMLEPVGGTSAQIPQLGSCVLRVRTEPGMPATFTSWGLGSFTSGMPTITVAADEQGIAEASFTASAGTVGDCPIVCASPVRGGTIRFLVRVSDQPVKGHP